MVAVCYLEKRLTIYNSLNPKQLNVFNTIATSTFHSSSFYVILIGGCRIGKLPGQENGAQSAPKFFNVLIIHEGRGQLTITNGIFTESSIIQV